MVLPAWIAFAQRCALEFGLSDGYRERVSLSYESAVRAIPEFGPCWRLQHPEDDG